MIVKNEIDVIIRCLSSCKSLIDYWVIVDTGSTDGTQQAIQQFLNDIPGELHQRPWIHFEYNRNEALQLAKTTKSDYILLADADDIFIYETNFQLINLDKDCYFVNIIDGNNRHKRIQLFKSELNFEWKGVIHEYLRPPSSFTYEILNDLFYVYLHDGSRSKDSTTCQKDIEILEKSLLEEPENSHYLFYLGQSYINNQNYLKAIEILRKRSKLGGSDEEIFICLLQIARLQQILNEQSEIIEESYLKAFYFRSNRIESLYYLGEYYKIHENYNQCYLISEIGLDISIGNDILFVENWIYEWGLLLLNSICAWHSNRHDLFFQRCDQLLNQDNLPEHIRQMIENGLKNAHETLSMSFSNVEL